MQYFKFQLEGSSRALSLFSLHDIPGFLPPQFVIPHSWKLSTPNQRQDLGLVPEISVLEPVATLTLSVYCTETLVTGLLPV